VPKQLFLLLLFILTAVVFLAGCGADIDRHVTFYRDEAWKAEMEFGFPAEMLALIAASPESLEAEIEKQAADWETKGVQVDWNSRREDTTLIYTFDVEGEGLELLNEIVFEDDADMTAVEVDGQRQIHFTYFTSGDFSAANSNTVTLEGSKIISSNGAALDGGTVQWVNHGGRMEAVLTEKSGGGVGTLLLVLLFLAGVGGGGWYFWKQRQQPQLQMQPSPTALCTHCGAPLGPQAKFCPSCGQQL
jgi:hypothetical protein